jgi:eukaryotic-like serine/threonine-protein kinase
MGEVFLGHDPRLQRRVALKCLIASSGQSGEDDQQRVLREARAAARLNHPNIAAVYDVLQQGNRTFIVMELVEGETLSACMARDRIPLDQVRLIGRQLASALASAHAQGVIHRDLKPANIHITPEGSIKVLDFGVAKLAASTSGESTELHTDPTIGGNPGTPNYMAPEQLFGRGVDARSDVYSAGVILYQMATGRRPYDATGAIPLAVAMSMKAPAAPSTLNHDVPPDLDTAIMTALEREPENRFQTARELEIALRLPGERSGTVSAPYPSSRGTTRRTWPPAATLAAVVIVIALIGVAAWRALPVWRTPRAPAAPMVATVAVLPAENRTSDPKASAFGATMTSVIAANLRSIEAIQLVPRESVAPFVSRRADIAAMHRDLGADAVVDLAVTATSPQLEVMARVGRAGDRTSAWQQTITGSPARVETAILDGVAGALSSRPEDLARLRKTPTTSDEALDAYVDALALLTRSDIAANVDTAIERLQRAAALDARFARASAALGTAILIKYEKARDAALIAPATDAIAAALRVDRDLSAAHTAFGRLQALTSHRDAAAEAFRRALALDPDNDEAHRLLGLRVLSPQGKTADAISELQRAVRIRPDSFDNHYYLGNVLYLSGHYREAVDAYVRATEILPARADVYTNLGATYHMLGDVDQALGNYEHAVSLGAGDALAYGNLAVAYFFERRYQQALAAGLEAVKRAPSRASLHRDLSVYYEALGRTRESQAACSRSVALAQQSIAINPRDASAIALIALCEANLGKAADAEGHAAEAVALAPDDRDVLLRAAKVCARIGNKATALDRLRKAVQRGLSPELARRDPELAPIQRLPEFESTISASGPVQGGRK